MLVQRLEDDEKGWKVECALISTLRNIVNFVGMPSVCCIEHRLTLKQQRQYANKTKRHKHLLRDTPSNISQIASQFHIYASYILLDLNKS